MDLNEEMQDRYLRRLSMEDEDELLTAMANDLDLESRPRASVTQRELQMSPEAEKKRMKETAKAQKKKCVEKMMEEMLELDEEEHDEYLQALDEQTQASLLAALPSHIGTSPPVPQKSTTASMQCQNRPKESEREPVRPVVKMERKTEGAPAVSERVQELELHSQVKRSSSSDAVVEAAASKSIESKLVHHQSILQLPRNTSMIEGKVNAEQLLHYPSNCCNIRSHQRRRAARSSHGRVWLWIGVGCQARSSTRSI